MKSPSRTLGFTILFMAGLAAIPVFADRPLASTVCTAGAVDIASGIYSQSTSHSNISGPALARRYAREASAYQRATQGSDRGLDIFYRVELTPQEAAVGKSVELTVTVGDARRKFKVNVPGGVQNGTRLRLKGEGNPGKNGGRPGDLFLVVTIR